MDKNKIKSFAIWARRNLISAVSERANRIGVTENKIEEAVAVQGGFKLVGNDEIFKLSKADRDNLVDEVNKKGFEQVMEEVAYTWFNRFMGLRYMEVNDYLPTGIRVLSSKNEAEGKTEPDVLTEVDSLIEELNLDINKVDKLLSDIDEDGNEKSSIQKQSDIRELYKYILVRQCNELGNIIPQMFEKISDYTELLLPDDLLEEGSVIRRMVGNIEEDDWKEEVEIIGWMYQYYISEKHDKVVGINTGIIKKNDIPAATQLFTPKWIVKYMIDNSLGKIWIDNNNTGKLKDNLEYYLEKNTLINNNEVKTLNPEDIKLLDNAMGSGHILVYAFDVFYKIYQEAGYSERDIPRKILENNLYGIDIDYRAEQLASFALIMKARHYNRILFKEIEKHDVKLNIIAIRESNSIRKEDMDYFTGANESIRANVEILINNYKDANEYGSIINLNKVDIKAIEYRLQEIENSNYENLFDMSSRDNIEKSLKPIIKQYKIMSRKYDVVATNPPYMGNYDKDLKKFIVDNYSDFKKDIFSVFIRKNFDYTKENGYLSFMTPMVWMFIKSFEKLRKYIINNKSISSLIELEYSGYEEATVPICTFILKNENNNTEGTYIKLSEFKGAKNQPIKVLEAISNPNCTYRYSYRRDDFKYIEGMPIAYWSTDKVKEVFKHSKSLSIIAEPKQGLATGNNDRFLKFWHEVNVNKIGINKTKKMFLDDGYKWAPCNKGGGFRRWYGNNDYLIDWENDGYDIRNFKDDKGKLRSRPQNIEYYFREGLTWSTLTSSLLSMRYSPMGFIFETKGSILFPKDLQKIWYLLGLLNSKIVTNLIKMISPTIDYHEGPLGKLPIILQNDEFIEQIVKKNISISKNDWDAFEISWDFKLHPLVKLSDKEKSNKLEEIFIDWQNECNKNFNQLKYNEEELNRMFIDIYALQDELTTEVEDKEVTIRKADRERDIKSFISYSVGCMFGRFSLDESGLIFAGYDRKCNEFDEQNKKGKCKFRWNCPKSEVDYNLKYSQYNSCIPDADNIIPITEDEYFEDDILSRFIDFVRTIYSDETLEGNLDFIADSIGRKPSETSRQAIRRYFIKDFYKDHLKIYQKRPIYWMFESGKNDGFKALVYMHRYDEQTVAKVRTDYLHTLQRKYEGEMQRQQLIVDSEEYTAKDRTSAKKKIDRITKQIEECREYDQVVAHLANEKISIDLDDGVKVNYEKFQGVTLINSKNKEVKMDLLAKI